MAVPKGDFSRLLRELRAAGPVDRVRLLARSLAALRELSPWDRKVLLRMAGFEGAEVLVERLAQEDEATAGKLRRLLGELEGRPDEMERTVRALADPKRRGEALDELLATLDRGLGQQNEVAGAPEAPAPDLPPIPEAPPVPEPSPIPERPPVPERAAKLQPPAPPSRASAPPLPPAAPGAPGRETAAKPAPEPRRTRAAPPRETAPAEPEREPPRARPPEPRGEAPTEPEPVDDVPPRWAAGILDRLLELRRRIAAGEAPDAGELRRVLETEIRYPWARRRALAAWLAAGPGDLGEALALIEMLPGATDRSWCLGVLAETGPWSEGEWQRIVAAAPTPATRRRLERRR